MSVESFPFDFQRTPNFFSGFNTDFGFHLSSMNGGANFEFVFASYSPDDIIDCLDGNQIDLSMVTVAQTCNANLVWNNDEEYISVSSDVTWNIGATHLPLQAVFLRDKATKFVMGYSIHPNPFNVTNKVIIRKDTVLWSFVDGV